MSGEPFIFPTTGLSQKDLDEGGAITIDWTPKAEYAWDAGVAMGRYFDGLKAGRLLGRVCRHCGRRLLPPRMFCELCFRPTDGWFEAQTSGTVKTFSLCHVTWDMRRIEQPLMPAVIDVDGASPGMGLLHLLGGVAPEAVRIGLRVRAVWKAPQERVGAITDIDHWAPEVVTP